MSYVTCIGVSVSCSSRDQRLSFCPAVLMTSADDPAALSQSVSLSYLLTAYLLQGISWLLQAVLTLRRGWCPFQRELLALARLDNLFRSEACFPPSFLQLSVTLLSVYLCVLVFVSRRTFSPLSCIFFCMFLSYISGVFTSLSPIKSTHLFSVLCPCFSPSPCNISSVNPWYQVVQQGRWRSFSVMLRTLNNAAQSEQSSCL